MVLQLFVGQLLLRNEFSNFFAGKSKFMLLSLLTVGTVACIPFFNGSLVHLSCTKRSKKRKVDKESETVMEGEVREFCVL